MAVHLTAENKDSIEITHLLGVVQHDFLSYVPISRTH